MQREFSKAELDKANSLLQEYTFKLKENYKAKRELNYKTSLVNLWTTIVLLVIVVSSVLFGLLELEKYNTPFYSITAILLLVFTAFYAVSWLKRRKILENLNDEITFTANHLVEITRLLSQFLDKNDSVLSELDKFEIGFKLKEAEDALRRERL